MNQRCLRSLLCLSHPFLHDDAVILLLRPLALDQSRTLPHLHGPYGQPSTTLIQTRPTAFVNTHSPEYKNRRDAAFQKYVWNTFRTAPNSE
jgi:hypothetical protein